MRFPIAVGTLCLLLFVATPVRAQGLASSFEQLAVLVKPGDKITVVDAAGRKDTARIAMLSRDTLTLVTPAGSRELGEGDVAEIQKRRDDSVMNGAIIGAVAGAAYFGTMLAILHETEDGDIMVPSAIVGGVMFAGLGAAAGAGIDALIKGKAVIYRSGPHEARLTVAPLLGRGRRGAAVVVKF